MGTRCSVRGMAASLVLIVASAGASSVARGADNDGPSITIYNQDFAVVRDTVPVSLKAGENTVSFAGVTAQLEPDSVILRDPEGMELSVLEQNYRGDPVSQERLLEVFEGKTIDFLITLDNREMHVPGKIVRSGYTQVRYDPYGRRLGGGVGASMPIIEMDGKLRFGLPGIPLFPSLADDSVLRPTLEWVIRSDRDARLDAEIGYVTRGMTWKADYNLVSPEKSDKVDLVAWVTVTNRSGTIFRNAKIKLMAGDVHKITSVPVGGGGRVAASRAAPAAAQNVTEKSFDELHLYTVGRRSTLRDQQVKQIEFARAEGMSSERIYVYDGASPQYGYPWVYYHGAQTSQAYGNQSNKKIWVMRQFMNTAENGLGIPLPKGRLRFYRRDEDGQLEFVGENTIDHTPKDERVRVYTGNSFDIVGERTQTNFRYDHRLKTIDEDFKIEIRNHKEEAVEVRIVEHLYRWSNWEIRDASDGHVKTDSKTIEFRVTVPPDGKHVVTYRAHYWW